MSISDREYYAMFGVDIDKISQSYGTYASMKTLENLRYRIEEFSQTCCVDDKIDVIDVFRIINNYEEELRQSVSNVKLERSKP